MSPLVSRRLIVGLLLLTVAATTLHLATHAPFAFYSPDVSYATAKIRRAAEGDLFRDPFSGTPSIYPSLFHAVFAVPQRVFGWTGFETARAVGIVDWVALFGSVFLLSYVLTRDTAVAACAALALPLVFYEPTGRHVLTEIPASFSIPVLVSGIALAVWAVEDGRGWVLAAGAFLVGLAVNVVWYQCVGALAMVTIVLWERWCRRWSGHQRPPVLAAGVCFALPFAFTAWHFWSIRHALPDYSGHVASQLGSPAGMGREWLMTLLARANFRFEPLLARSLVARLHWYALALPAGVALLGVALALRLRLRGDQGAVAERLRRAFATALLVFLFSIALAVTRDVPRLAVVQFAGYVLLLPFTLGALAHVRPRALALLRWPLAAAGILAACYTVRHTDSPFAAEPDAPTMRVVQLIASLPEHRDTRIFVSAGEVRRLAPFVTFLSFTNHAIGGRYYSQDPVSSMRLLAAHGEILGAGKRWRETLAASGVRYLVFRHAAGGPELEAATFYLKHGRPVLATREWWVLEVDSGLSKG